MAESVAQTEPVGSVLAVYGRFVRKVVRVSCLIPFFVLAHNGWLWHTGAGSCGGVELLGHFGMVLAVTVVTGVVLPAACARRAHWFEAAAAAQRAALDELSSPFPERIIFVADRAVFL